MSVVVLLELGFRDKTVTMDSGIEGSSQAPCEPQLGLSDLQFRPGIVFPSGVGYRSSEGAVEEA